MVYLERPPRSRCGNRELDAFVSTLRNSGQNFGIEISDVSSIDEADMGTIEGYIKNCAEHNVDLLVIILPRKSSGM